MKKKNGFTLIELLAVIIILGILMIIAIPSVTKYISDSRKSAYVDTAKEIISGARNMVNDGKLEMYATDTTYYIPTSCIKTENASKSPYGDFTKAYIGVIYDGNGFKYYWISVDDAGQGVSKITPLDKLDTDSIESDLKDSDIENVVTSTGIGNRTEIKILSCNTTTNVNSWEGQYHLDDISNNASEEDGGGSSSGGSGGGSQSTTINTLKTSSASQLNSIGDNVYIYKGANPNNYVTFNGNELWRIVGIYGDNLKILKSLNELIVYRSDDSAADAGLYASSDLCSYLNGTFYNSLSSTAKSMIETKNWNVGATIPDIIASVDYSNAKTSTWNGKVGVISTYEFLYASDGDNCENVLSGDDFETMCGKANHNWLKPVGASWTLNPLLDYPDIVLEISINGKIIDYFTASNEDYVLATVFLKSSVKITGGTGTQSDPYILSL